MRDLPPIGNVCTSIVQFKSRTSNQHRCGLPLYDLNGALVCMVCDAGTILPGELDAGEFDLPNPFAP